MTQRSIIDSSIQPTLDEFKQHIRITTTDQDTLLKAYLRAAVVAAEHYVGRCLAMSDFVLDTSFSSSIVLASVDPDYYPIVGTPTVKVDGTQTTAFSIDGNVLTFDESVTGSTVTVSYQASGLDMPDDMRIAVLLTASKFFNNPVDSVEGMPSVATNLLSQYRRYGLNGNEV